MLLVGKGISTEELFQVINSNKPVQAAMEILSQEEEDEDGVAVQCSKSLGVDSNGSISFEKSSSELNNAIISNSNQGYNINLISKYKDVKSKKDLKVFLKKKKKELAIDFTSLISGNLGKQIQSGQQGQPKKINSSFLIPGSGNLSPKLMEAIKNNNGNGNKEYSNSNGVKKEVNQNHNLYLKEEN